MPTRPLHHSRTPSHLVRHSLARLAVALSLVLGTAPALAADVTLPNFVSYKGYLTTPSGVVLDKLTKNIQVQLFDAATGGNAVYAESHANVAITQGRFDLLLGSTGAGWAQLDFTRPLWLALTIDGEALNPRIALTSVPYARATEQIGELQDTRVCTSNGGRIECTTDVADLVATTPAALLRLSEVAAGADCTAGGQLLSTGIDSNGNGVLDDTEVTTSRYVCHGMDGEDSTAVPPAALLRLTDVSAGADCPAGGSLLSTGVDSDGNGVLDDAEISASKFVCHGADGQAGAQGPVGPAGTPGAGVPTGGATGQVLAKSSNADYATAWVTPSASGGATPKLRTNSGSLLAVSVQCQTGEVVTGGGCGNPSAPNLGPVWGSFPICNNTICADGAAPNGWHCEFNSAGPFNTAYAVCQ